MCERSKTDVDAAAVLRVPLPPPLLLLLLLLLPR